LPIDLRNVFAASAEEKIVIDHIVGGGYDYDKLNLDVKRAMLTCFKNAVGYTYIMKACSKGDRLNEIKLNHLNEMMIQLNNADLKLSDDVAVPPDEETVDDLNYSVDFNSEVCNS